jgi:hypothetical protein
LLNDTLVITVTALNGSSLQYFIYLKVDLNFNTRLSAIYVDSILLASFHPEIYDYTYTLSSDYQTIPWVSAQTEDLQASDSISNAEQIPGQTRIIVTAENGRDQAVYRINFNKSVHVVWVESEKPLISLYPNPAQDRISIQAENTTLSVLNILDMQGRTINHLTINDRQYTVDISHLAKGIYMLKIHTDKGIVIRKLVKQ